MFGLFGLFGRVGRVGRVGLLPTMLTFGSDDANNVGIRMTTPLGEFEVLILLAVMRLGDDAHPPAVRAEIEARAGRDVQRGAVYVTLDRLEAKGLLNSRVLDATEGTRARSLYRASPRGLKAVRRALIAVDSMRAGLDILLEEK
jgi:PadR family transcriptional regulator PadR